MGICHFLCFAGIITEFIQVEDPGPGFEELLPRLPELVVASRNRSTASNTQDISRDGQGSYKVEVTAVLYMQLNGCISLY